MLSNATVMTSGGGLGLSEWYFLGVKDIPIQHFSMIFNIGAIAEWIAGLGSLAAASVALWSVHSERKQRAEDQRSHEVKIAHELMLALKSVVSNVTALERHFYQNKINVSVSVGGKLVDTYKIAHPIIGISTEGGVLLPPGGADLVFRVGGADLWRDAIQAIDLNRSIHAIMKEYVKIYDGVIKYFYYDDSGGLVLRLVDGHQLEKVKAHLSSINDLTKLLNENIYNTILLCHSLNERLSPDLEKYFGQSFPDLFT